MGKNSLMIEYPVSQLRWQRLTRVEKNITIDDMKAVIWVFKRKIWISAIWLEWCPLWAVILKRMGMFAAHWSGGNWMSRRGCVSFDDLWPSISLLTWLSSYWRRQVSTSVHFRQMWWAIFRPDPGHLMNFVTRLWLHNNKTLWLSNHVTRWGSLPPSFSTSDSTAISSFLDFSYLVVYDDNY